MLVGFLDTKLAEHVFVYGKLREAGCEVVVLDTSIKEVRMALS